MSNTFTLLLIAFVLNIIGYEDQIKSFAAIHYIEFDLIIVVACIADFIRK
jgi:hypothetical protein